MGRLGAGAGWFRYGGRGGRFVWIEKGELFVSWKGTTRAPWE